MYSVLALYSLVNYILPSVSYVPLVTSEECPPIGELYPPVTSEECPPISELCECPPISELCPPTH